MRISTGGYRLRLLIWFFPILLSIALIGIIQGQVYELLIVVVMMGLFGLVFYFLLPDIIEVSVVKDSIQIRKGSKEITEPISNIEELTQTFSFLNQNFTTWTFYRLTLIQSTELGRTFHFLSRDEHKTKEAIGKLKNYIAAENNRN